MGYEPARFIGDISRWMDMYMANGNLETTAKGERKEEGKKKKKTIRDPNEQAFSGVSLFPHLVN